MLNAEKFAGTGPSAPPPPVPPPMPTYLFLDNDLNAKIENSNNESIYD